MVVATPTEKTNAPLIGCESADTARHATTYDPWSSAGRSAEMVVLPSTADVADVDRLSAVP